MEEVSKTFVTKFEGHSKYLSPEWTFASLAEETEEPAEIGHDILSLVSTELSSYISSHVQFRHEALQDCGVASENGEAWLSLDTSQQDILQSHAALNFKYCQQLLKYLINTHAEETGAPLTLAKVSDVFIEYMDYAPGPWREAAFVDALIRNIIPRLVGEEASRVHNIQSSLSAPSTTDSHANSDRQTPGTSDTLEQSSSAPTAAQSPQLEFVSTPKSRLFAHAGVAAKSVERHVTGDNATASGNASVESDHDLGSKSGSLTDGFDMFDEEFSETTSILGGSLNNLNLTRSDQQKLANKLKRAVHTINRLKTESAMLKDSLQAAKASDMTLLQDKWRGAQADLATIRRRNAELKDRVQVLEANLFDALNPQKAAEAETEIDEFESGNIYEGKNGPARRGSHERADTVSLNDFAEDDEEDMFHEANSSSSMSSSINTSNKLTNGLLHRAKVIAVAAQSRKLRLTSTVRPADTQVHAQLQEQIAQIAHLQKIVSAYESRLSTRQATIDRYASADANATANVANTEKKSEYEEQPVVHEGASLLQLLTALPATVSREHRKYIERAALEQIQTAKDVDRRTIESLIQENDRINALLPPATAEIPENEVAIEGVEGTEVTDKADTSTPQDGKNATAPTTAVGICALTPSESRRRILAEKAAAHTYGPSALLVSCLVGFLLTLLTPWLKKIFRS